MAGGQHQHRCSGCQAEGATRDGRGGTTEQLVQDQVLQGGSPTAMRCAAGHQAAYACVIPLPCQQPPTVCQIAGNLLAAAIALEYRQHL
ncbi:hypothetical protein XOC_2176 [Xanthomonas oryzae pv. oryzicola BLS256]|uniref:Uncharacterized protein n=1 Tax=Xanthomonas oryzae pv. oryzicola (strain BLS256) TaxID=383407 RepID=G7TDI0_XANOB|nr:hypothetical protein XOC_2176 [Xanthomonas oryzae pv. oryzicola BLS256]QEO97717.1 hypothetical protein XOCgx_2727 [Xanthomonas oryzae pv. oryzicola]